MCIRDSARRALVQAATGVGKTYLAAFDSKNYERVLFVAHREEILKPVSYTHLDVYKRQISGLELEHSHM